MTEAETRAVVKVIASCGDAPTYLSHAEDAAEMLAELLPDVDWVDLVKGPWIEWWETNSWPKR